MGKPTPVPGLGSDTPLRVATPLLVAARVRDVRRHEAAVAERLDPDAVHDMRVAIRRLRAAIRLFRGSALAALDPELKELQDALGRVRDVQVQLAWLARVRRRLGLRQHAKLRTWAERQLPDLVDGLLPRLEGWTSDLAPRLEAAAVRAGRGGKLGGGRVRKGLAKRLARAERLAAQAREDPRPEPAHALRIAVKKLRYLAELVEPAFPDAIPRLLEALEPLQEALGELHDVDVRIARMWELAVRGRKPERRAARRLLPPLERERGRRARELVALLEAGAGPPLAGTAEAIEAA